MEEAGSGKREVRDAGSGNVGMWEGEKEDGKVGKCLKKQKKLHQAEPLLSPRCSRTKKVHYGNSIN